MIRRFFCLLMIVALCGGCALAQPELVRLHVVAEDDGDAAQALKLELRDACLRCAEVCLMDAPDAASAYMLLWEHLDDFQRVCESRARELGYAGEIRAEAGVFEFPDRIYGDLLVPAGEYPALRVTIGAGEGHNWWCVLYPSLCLIDETESEPGSLLAWLKERLGGAV